MLAVPYIHVGIADTYAAINFVDANIKKTTQSYLTFPVVFYLRAPAHLRSMEMIHYRDMLKALEGADHENGSKTVNIVYVSCNRAKKTGGKLVTVLAGKKCGLPYHCTGHEMRGIIDDTGKKTAVHTRLILQFNGSVVYQ